MSTPTGPAPARKMNSRAGRQAPRGDVTGAKREALQREAADALKEREGELTMITAERQRSIDNDIVDLTGDEPVLIKADDDEDDGYGQEPSADKGDDEIVDMQNPERDQLDQEIEAVLSKPGQPKVELVAEPKPVSARRREVLQKDPKWWNRIVTIRVNCDLPEFTYGHGNTVTLEEGRRYRVPYKMAAHLEEKGVLWGPPVG